MILTSNAMYFSTPQYVYNQLLIVSSVMDVLLVAPMVVSVVNSGTVFGGGPFEKDRTVLLQNTFL